MINIETLGVWLSVIISVVTVGGILYKGLTKILKDTTKDTIKTQMDEYTKSIDTKFTQLETEITELNRKLDDFATRENETNDMLKRSLLASSRDRINQAHSVFMAQEFIGAHSMFVLDELYASYKELGGNSFIDKQMEDLHSLEVINAETIEHNTHKE